MLPSLSNSNAVDTDIVLSTKPFAGYDDFADCVAQNSGKDDPQGYCAAIMRRVEKARIYVRDPSKAPPGVQLNTGPRGGRWFDSNSVPKSPGYKPTKSPKQPKGKAPKAKPEKRAIGQPFKGAGDPELPKNVLQESPEVQDAWVKAFNDVLSAGGSEADALAAAKKTLPDRASKKPPVAPKPKRAIGSPFQGGTDPSLPRTIQQEAPQIREQWVKTFNETLAKSGSEADAIHAANLVLPLRTNPKAPSSRAKQPKTSTEPAKRKELTMPEETTRAMICLYLNPTIADMLAIIPTVESAAAGIELESAEDLHITLAYYPMVKRSERDELIKRAASLASNFSAPRTVIEGLAQFFPGEDDPVPHVLLVDPTELHEMHRSLCYYGPASPIPAKSHGYIPHITLAYVPQGVSLRFSPPAVPPLLFDHLSVVFDNEERHNFRFGYSEDVGYWAQREREAKVDEGGNTVDPSGSPQMLSSTTQKDEDMNTETNIPEIPVGAPGDPGTTQEKAGRRMRGSMRELLAKLLESATGLRKYADYEDEDEGGEEDEAKALELIQQNGSFVVFKDKATGQSRWLSFSSNGFEDREREIIATDALEKAVAKADETGNRGPLRLFHIKTGSQPSDPSLADIGDCDFQAIQGRFLIEAGTFRDTELAQRALAYFSTTEEKLGTSVGFTHPRDAFDGKCYTVITSLVERSVLPHHLAANPWTAFTTLRGEPMDAVKSAWLERVAGPELAKTIIKQADEATKNLEGSIAFKENAELTAALETVKSAIQEMPAETKDAFSSLVTNILSAQAAPVEEKKEATPPSETSAPAFDETAFLARIEQLVKPIAAGVEQANTTAEATINEVKAISDRVKSLEDERLAEKARQENAPRGSEFFRATSATENIDVARSKEQEAETMSPAAAYANDLLNGRVAASA